MKLLVAVALTATAILFLLATLALSASGQLRHPIRDGSVLTAMLILGLALLAD
jgi:hypothetical protein